MQKCLQNVVLSRPGETEGAEGQLWGLGNGNPAQSRGDLEGWQHGQAEARLGQNGGGLRAGGEMDLGRVLPLGQLPLKPGGLGD